MRASDADASALFRLDHQRHRFELGFGDLSYFNHAFRRRYAASPSSTRKAARGGGSAAFHPLPNDNDNHALKSGDALSATSYKRELSATMVQVGLQEPATAQQTSGRATRL